MNVDVAACTRGRLDLWFVKPKVKMARRTRYIGVAPQQWKGRLTVMIEVHVTTSRHKRL